MSEKTKEIKEETNNDGLPKEIEIERKCPRNIPGNENVKCFDCEILTC